MKIIRFSLLIGSLVALLVIAVTPVGATPVTINNASFELPSVAPGHGSSTITDWTKTGSGTAGVWHATLAVPDGVQYAYADSMTLSQQLTATIQLGATYTLAAYTRRYQASNDIFRVQLYAVTGSGDVLVKEVYGVSPYRTWTEEQTSWKATGYAGDPLKIKLVGTSGEIDFDKVSLDYAAVPIPATVLLFGTGLLGLIFCRRFQRS